MNNPDWLLDSYSEEMITKLAQEEAGKRQYYRPVYSLHKWWARRPGALFRSIILLATRAATTESLFVSERDGSLSERSDYFGNHCLKDIIIFDPFMGGGTTLAEASRLGAKVIGCDINPVSYWVVRETLKSIDLQKLEAYFRQLEQTAGEQIRSLYRTTCPGCRSQGEGLYAFWVRYIACPECDAGVDLFKRTLLNEGIQRNKPVSRSNPAIAFCPRCYALNEWHGKEPCSCRECQASFDPQNGTYDEGYYTCPHCQGGPAPLLKAMRAGQQLQERLIAIEYWCPRCRDRLYKTPDASDLCKIEEIQQTFDASKEQLVFPREPILEGASSVRWRLHNYRYYHQVFNTRQLLAFNYLVEAIRAIPEEEYRNAFFTIFSNSLEYNNMMTPYNYPHRKLHHLFNYHAMPLTTTPVENAVWGVAEEGAGTFVNCYTRYRRAKQYCEHPFDKFKGTQNEIRTVYAREEKIATRFVETFEDLRQTERGALLRNGDSSHLPGIPSRSVDFVVTDPPYYDNIHYSELSNFFYVWLRSLIQHPYFTAGHVPTDQEAIVNKGMDKGQDDYCRLLAFVFRECERVLKDSGQMIFTFHHTKWKAWWILLTALAESRFCVEATFPVTSEYKVNPHVRNKQAMDMDLVLICRKKTAISEPLPTDPDIAISDIMHHLSSARAEGKRNQWFLRFMGGLLKVAITSWEHPVVNYEWFAGNLSRFGDWMTREMSIVNENASEPVSSVQLELFEAVETA